MPFDCCCCFCCRGSTIDAVNSDDESRLPLDEKSTIIRSKSHDCFGNSRRVSLKLVSNARNMPIASSPKGILAVELFRTDAAPLGLGIAGGTDRSLGPTVSCLRPGSLAHRCDQLQVGDGLVSVNGVSVSELTHAQVLALLRNAGRTVRLEVDYCLDDRRFVRPFNTCRRLTDVTIDKEGPSFGVTFRGGAFGPDGKKTRPLVVAAIRPGGPVDREGRLRVGDRLLAIDGVDISKFTLSSVLKILSETVDARCFTIEYDVSILESVRHARGALLLEISKLPGVDLGVELKMLENTVEGRRKTAIFIAGVVTASVADRCGALHVGDQLTSIDGISLELTTLAESAQLLRGFSSSSFAGRPSHSAVRLEIIPYSQMAGRTSGQSSECPSRRRVRSPSVKKKKTVNCEQKIVCKRSTNRARSQDLSIRNADQIDNYSNRQKNEPLFSSESAFFHNSRRQFATPNDSGHCKNGNELIPSSFGSLSVSLSGVPCGQVCHSEVMEVVLNSYIKGGFGMILHRQHGFTDLSRSPLFISYIERGSSAEKSGLLQVGDRILTINDWCTSNGTAEEANYIIRHAQSPLALAVEFDVIETVLPSSGVFTVKLAKRGNNNLGIVARSETGGRKGKSVIIADIRTGSVAHRCGSIQPGDRLLTIDNIPLNSCTVEEAMRLLQRTSDIVKLRVCKNSRSVDDDEHSDNDQSQTVVFSVQLNRRRRPLGITISSGGLQGDPVFISQLAPGGLAERSGALHVGDRILAINDESLENRKVDEAMQMLQNSRDDVTLKLVRFIEPAFFSSPRTYRNRHRHRMNEKQPQTDYEDRSDNKLGTPVQSIDSAVESLEEQSPEIVQKQAEELSAQLNHRLTFDRPSISNHLNPLSTMTTVIGTTVGRPTLEAVSTTSSSNGGATSGGGGTTIQETGWDSGLSSSDTLGNGTDFCGCSCQDAVTSHGTGENWVRILEALETVGEAEMLKKLEESILCGTVPKCDHQPVSISKYDHNTTRCEHQTSSTLALKHDRPTDCRPSGSISFPNDTPTSGVLLSSAPPSFCNTILRRPQIAVNNMGSMDSNDDFNADLPPPMAPPKPPRPISTMDDRLSALIRGLERNPVANDNADDDDQQRQRRRPPIDLCNVTLIKDTMYGDFGFSVSDGDGNSGVYINKIRDGGPADKSGMVKPFDRILQVNDTSLQFLDCILAVPLLLSATDKIDLLLCRDPTGTRTIPEKEETSIVGYKDSAV